MSFYEHLDWKKLEIFEFGYTSFDSSSGYAFKLEKARLKNNLKNSSYFEFQSSYALA